MDKEATDITTEKDNKMDLNGLASLVDTVRAGSNGNFMGGGGGEGGNSGYGAYSGPTAIRADILSNRAIADTGIENLQREFANVNTRDRITEGFNRICDKIADNFALTTGQNHAIEVKLCGMEKDAVATEGRILAEVKAVEARAISHDRDKAERMVERLMLQNECGCGCEDRRSRRG